jgi:tetratricopeptide (TPR) repeat protein
MQKTLDKKITKSLKKIHTFLKTVTLSTVVSSAVLLCIIYFLLSPYLYYRAGTIFFGRVPQLYNVTLANYFFSYAAYPLIGKPAPFAHYQLARTLFIEGNLSAALNEANKEVHVYPSHTTTYYLLGLIYGYLNSTTPAINSFSRYIDSYPTTWAGRNDKAWLQFKIGDIDGALATITPVADDITNPWIQNTYGALLMNKGKYNEAKIAFTYASKMADMMSEDSWGRAYPGNDPRIYKTGLDAMKSSIQSNLKLIDEKQKTTIIPKK